MSKSYRDLLREARAAVREVTTAETERAAREGAVLVDVREAGEWEQGHIGGAHHVSKSFIEQEIEGLAPDRRGAGHPLLRGRHPVPLRGPDTAGHGLHRRGLHERRLPGLEVGGSSLHAARGPHRRAEAALFAPPAHPGGRRGRPGEAPRLTGALHRRGRPGLAGHALPSRGRRGHHRHRRLRRRGRLQPAAPGRPPGRPRRHEEDGIGGADHPGAQPGRSRGDLRGDARTGQRGPPHRRRRPHLRRHGYLRDALHAQRRRRARWHPGRARLRLPLRGPADGLHAPRGALLSLPLPDPAASGAGARLLGGRRAGRRARRHGPAAGHGGHQGPPRHRRLAGRAPAHLRRPGRLVQRAAAAARPALPGLRRRRAADARAADGVFTFPLHPTTTMEASA